MMAKAVNTMFLLNKNSMWLTFIRGPIRLVCTVAAFIILTSAPAAAQSGAQQDNIGEDAIDAVTQPLSDLNLRSKDIPIILTLAQREPYNLETMDNCINLRTEVARLDDVLGPDANEPAEKAGLVNKGLRAGGNILGGFIPFRGLVRQLSGARAEEKRWDSAIYAGVTRRSFLKGYMAAKQCESSEDVSVNSARELLGLPEASE